MTSPTNEIALDALAAKIRTEHGAVRDAAETATQHAIRCGKLLAEAKNELVHGQWLPWLRDHCNLSERTAQAYMRLARKHGEFDEGKAQRVADLPVREAMKAIADVTDGSPRHTFEAEALPSHPGRRTLRSTGGGRTWRLPLPADRHPEQAGGGPSKRHRAPASGHRPGSP